MWHQNDQNTNTDDHQTRWLEHDGTALGKDSSDYGSLLTINSDESDRPNRHAKKQIRQGKDAPTEKFPQWLMIRVFLFHDPKRKRNKQDAQISYGEISYKVVDNSVHLQLKGYYKAYYHFAGYTDKGDKNVEGQT